MRIRDRRSGKTETVSAKVVINATGPWADRTRRLAGIPGELLHPTKGVHAVLRGPVAHAMFVASPRDGRMFYILPLERNLLLGTTDTAYPGDPGEAEPLPEEIAYLEKGSLRVLPGSSLFRQKPLFTYAGVRPLLQGKGKTESRISRRHGVFREGEGGRFVTVAGGKLTTFREMAEKGVDAACEALGRRSGCLTRESPFPGEIGGGGEGVAAFTRSLSGMYDVPESLCAHLVSLYGRRASRVLSIAREVPGADRRLSPHSPDIAAQAILAVREEWAENPEDAILRRMHLGISEDRGACAVPAVEEILAKERPGTG